MVLNKADLDSGIKTPNSKLVYYEAFQTCFIPDGMVTFLFN